MLDIGAVGSGGDAFAGLGASAGNELMAGAGGPPEVSAREPAGNPPFLGGHTPTLDSTTNCPPGTHLGQRSCPEGQLCTAVLTCIADAVLAPTPTNGSAPGQSPLQAILGPVTGSTGGVGAQFGIGTAGTRLVAGASSNPLRTLAILAIVAAVGYILYKRYYKKGAAE